MKQLRTQYPETVFAAAGDLIGASTFESFIAQDKPTIDALNSAGLEVSAVGNHEFDQGYDDLVNRVMAPYDATTNPYGGANWKYLGANVRKAADHSAALPETWMKDVGGVQVGFIGAVTDHLSELVSPAGIAGLEIESPVVAANRHAEELKAQGADIVVLLVHEGAETTALSSATDPATDFGEIVTGVNDDVDAIISGHTHLSYNHSVTVPGWVSEGRPVTTRPVVSAGQYGYNLDQLLYTVDPDTDEVLGLQQSTLPLVKTPAYPTDAATKAIVDKAVADAAVLGAQPLGQITGPFNRAKLADGTTENRGGESTLGNLVAEVQQTATESTTTGSAQIAFMNPGGLRGDMTGSSTTYPTTLTYKQAANVQPFANTLVNMRMTGAHIKAALEQQWQPAGASRPFLKLGISEGFTYTYDPRAAAGSRITEMRLNGAPISPASIYSVTVNSFLASGGDNFGAFALGTSKKDTGQTDLQAMVDFMADRKTVSPDFTQRAVGVLFPAGAPASYFPGDKVSFDLSSLAFSAPADLRDSSVRVSLGETQLGTFTVDNTLGTAVTDEYGTASVSVVLPSSVPAGVQHLTVTGTQTGTTTTVPVTVAALVTTTMTLAASATSQPYGTSTPATLTATVAQGDGAAPSGSVRFETSGGTTLATVAVVDGKATYEVPPNTPAGALEITATFVPSSATGIVGSSSSVVTFTVDKAVSSTTLTATGSKVKVRGATTYELAMTATVTLDTGKPAVGTVTFYADDEAVGSAAVGTGGTASVTVPESKGSVQVRAEFSPTDTGEPPGLHEPDADGDHQVAPGNEAAAFGRGDDLARTLLPSLGRARRARVWGCCGASVGGPVVGPSRGWSVSPHRLRRKVTP